MNEGQSDYEALIAPIERSMMQTAWRVLSDADEAEEAFQDTVVQIWRKLPRIRAAREPHALILKICTDCALDRLRKRQRQRNRDRCLPIDEIAIPNTCSVESEVDDAYAKVMDAIGKLPHKQSTAIVMRFIQQNSYDVIAAAMKCTETTARKHVSRGLARLRKFRQDSSEQVANRSKRENGQ